MAEFSLSLGFPIVTEPGKEAGVEETCNFPGSNHLTDGQVPEASL